MRIIFFLLTALVTLLSSPVAYATELTVRVLGLESREGAILYAVFDDHRAFPADYDSAVTNGYLDLSQVKEEVSITIPLDPGRYAVALIHDQNGNSELDVGAFDIPVEGYGFSNNPSAMGGPPSFNDSALDIAAEDVIVEVLLQY